MFCHKKVIAVYSGSFNPFHYGHLDIIRDLYETPSIDKVLVVVSPKNPGKSESVYIQSPSDRFLAVKSVIDSEGMTDKVEVSDIEFTRTQPIYTVETLREIRTLYPDDIIFYVAGADSLEKIQRWKNAKELLCDFSLMVFPRSGYDLPEIIKATEEKYPGAQILPMMKMPREISSTEIRRRIEAGEDYSELTPVKVDNGREN